MKSNSLREAEMWKEHVQKRSCKTFPKICVSIFWKWLSISVRQRRVARRSGAPRRSGAVRLGMIRLLSGPRGEAELGGGMHSVFEGQNRYGIVACGAWSGCRGSGRAAHPKRKQAASSGGAARRADGAAEEQGVAAVLRAEPANLEAGTTYKMAPICSATFSQLIFQN